MALEKAIFDYTKEQVESVGNRVYAVAAPQVVASPYIVFTVISNNFVNSIGGDSGLCEARVQFSVWGAEYKEVKPVVEKLKAAYRKYVEGDSSEKMKKQQWVQATILNNETDSYEDETRLYHTALDVIFWHVEEDE